MRNQYEDDTVLQNILKRIVPASVLQEFEPDLSRFGERVVNGIVTMLSNHGLFPTSIIDILELGNDVETPSNYPRLIQYDAWCRLVAPSSVLRVRSKCVTADSIFQTRGQDYDRPWMGTVEPCRRRRRVNLSPHRRYIDIIRYLTGCLLMYIML